MGVTVQHLSNTLAGDRILAKAYFRVDPILCKTTVNDAMAMCVPLLSQALVALKSSNGLSNTTLGVNRSIPGNQHIFSAVAKMTTARLSRLFYGAF